MKKRILFILLKTSFLFLNNYNAFAPNCINNNNNNFNVVLLYNSWGSIYNPVANQCDSSPLITGSGFRINPKKASEHKIIAISHEMLYDEYRQNLLKDTINDKRFKGKLLYGDSVYIQSPTDSLGNFLYPNLNGWWYVEDTKNKKYKNSVDFLQTCGDNYLYNNDSLWNGRFENLKIYKIIYHNKEY